jgi:hypothetical protein
MQLQSLERRKVSDIEKPGILAGYLTERELASQLRVTVRSLQLWKVKRTGPPVTSIGCRPYYRKDAVAAWLASLEMPMVREPSRKRRRRAAAEAQSGAA